MFHYVFYSVLSTLQPRLCHSSSRAIVCPEEASSLRVKNSRSGYRSGSKNGAQQKLSR
jgi:hypothetical protein